ncbi:hypothetical protein G3U99_08025 [Vibrio coralliilyticus OCN008]|uniref:hypothetical protein n=1 Tax=Vibrio coralliilyticus TaxID=190893 RepID=UPI00039173EF|nr:hypothetical protein [Vibrio coralliilyticus]ERB64486.1 hypothetical protein N779_14975 [Vibrio coralliilyticus OCN008]QIJ84203.1 hypothetical protein G3U99_08025 [Vibrio coralliilyticus OCN008]
MIPCKELDTTNIWAVAIDIKGIADTKTPLVKAVFLLPNASEGVYKTINKVSATPTLSQFNWFNVMSFTECNA